MQDARIRKIIHIDMDASFASSEQRNASRLRGKPVACANAVLLLLKPGRDDRIPANCWNHLRK
jgi:hypothetical protein